MLKSFSKFNLMGERLWSSHIDNCIAATIYTQDIVVKKESKISKKFKE